MAEGDYPVEVQEAIRKLRVINKGTVREAYIETILGHLAACAGAAPAMTISDAAELAWWRSFRTKIGPGGWPDSLRPGGPIYGRRYRIMEETVVFAAQLADRPVEPSCDWCDVAGHTINNCPEWAIPDGELVGDDELPDTEGAP